MKPSLFICPSGQPLPTEGPYTSYIENHWRRTDRGHREYETVIVNYNYDTGFEPEPNTYDKLINKKGLKWQITHDFIRENCDMIMDKYEYIGSWDDDIQTDIESVNHGLIMAHNLDAKLWQLSLTADSELNWPTLRNNPSLAFSLTNFSEAMGQTFHTSIIPTLLDFWSLYEIKTGWGFDVALCEIIESPALVIHSKQMFHPPRVSTYDKTAAFEEMDYCINQAYPAFIKKHFDINAPLNTTQVVYREVAKIV